MIINDFNGLPKSGIRYGGNAGAKLGVIIDGENWLIKFPKSTKDLATKVDISYTTAPLSEYLGSQIYASIGIDVHETRLGICNNKLVVACKDFRTNPVERFDDYHSISNDYVEGLEEKILEQTSSTSDPHSVDLDEVSLVMQNNPLFKKMPELKKRFWQMFIIDAFIDNNDRNNSNWGVLVNNTTNEIRIAPVFDNGNAFSNKASDQKLQGIMNDETRFYSSVYETKRCIFSVNGKQINPLKYIEKMENPDCNDAILDIVPRIDLDRIDKIIYEIPNEYEGIKIISDVQKEFYYLSLAYRYENTLRPTYNQLLWQQEDLIDDAIEPHSHDFTMGM